MSRSGLRRTRNKKKQLRGHNTFVPPRPYYEFQFDLFFINDMPNQKIKVGALMIDIFTKYMVVAPINSRQEDDVAIGIIEGFNKMKGKPEIIYTDDETAFSTPAIQDYLKKEGIHHHITRGHPNFAERAIRTYKDMLYKKVEADEKKGKKTVQWTDYNLEILLTYNDKMVHSSTGMTPKEALKGEKNLKAKIKMSANATRSRKYPEIQIGDRVKIYRKKAITEKERTSNWSNETYEVEGIEKKLGQTYFKTTKRERLYLRHELLKV